MKIKPFLVLIFVISIYLVSCSDDPNSVGIEQLPDEDQLQTILFSTLTENVEQSIITFQEDSLYWGSSNRLLLGQYDNISSEALISFQMLLPDSVKTPLQENDDISLIDSWIEIYPTYWLGDSSNFTFTAHQINTSWNSVKIDQDTVDKIRAELGANILYDYSYEAGDTVIKFRIGNELVNSWIKRSYDTSFPDDNGLMLKPLSTNGIIGFQGLTGFPAYKYPTLFMVFEKTGEFIDTVEVAPGLDIHLPSGELKPNPVNSILLQGSFNVRGRLIFDLEKLPANILINSAKLDLFVNDDNTIQGSVKSDTIAVSFYHNFSADSIRYDFGKYPLLRSNDKYSGEIRQFVQRWVGGESNEGLELKLSDENRSPARVAIYSSDHPIESLRPRLSIYYTK